jgi:hypothetical protein
VILKYHFSASLELDDAVQWYEEQKEGLGISFAQEVELTIKRIQNFPDSNPVLEKGFRRAVVTTYPYGIFYKTKGEIIEIYSISHLHRRPGFWSKRKLE